MAKRSIVMRGLIIMVILMIGGCSVGGLMLAAYNGTGGIAVAK